MAQSKTAAGVIDLPPKPTPALEIVGNVRALHIERPDDVIVITITEPVSRAELDRIVEMWKEITGLQNPVVCFVKGIDVKVVHPA